MALLLPLRPQPGGWRGGAGPAAAARGPDPGHREGPEAGGDV